MNRIRSILAPLFLVACEAEGPMVSGVPDGVLPADQAPPPAFSLSAPDWAFPGDVVTMTVGGLPSAGLGIRFAGSTATSGPAYCPAAFGGCFGLFAPGTTLGLASTVLGGVAGLSVTVPNTFVPRPVYLQAGIRRAPNTYLSNIETLRVLQPDLDEDVDGLVNLDEDARGTNPLVLDSDGGGESDGSEVIRGANPLDPADDAAPPTCGYVGFEDAFVALGEGGDPTAVYGPRGLTFSTGSGYGVIGGLQYGDPGNWDEINTVPTPAWGGWDFGTDVNAIDFATATNGVTFTGAVTAGGSVIELQTTAYYLGSVVSQTTEAISGRTTITLTGMIDRLEFTLVGGDGFAYAIDDLFFSEICN